MKTILIALLVGLVCFSIMGVWVATMLGTAKLWFKVFPHNPELSTMLGLFTTVSITVGVGAAVAWRVQP